MENKNPHVGTPYQTTDKTDGSTTSREAAEDTNPRTPNQRERAWIYVESQGDRGATAQETNAALEIRHNCCSRFTELRQMGRIRRNGKTRRTENGSKADVFVAVPWEDWTDKRKNWPAPRKPKKEPVLNAGPKIRTALKAFDDIISRSSEPGLYQAAEIIDIAKRARLSLVT